MPELPEMETYKSLLQPLISGQIITQVTVNREKSINVPVNQFKAQVENQKIEDIQRRAKYLIFHLQNGSCLLLHLMLGGKMFHGKEEDKPDRTVQVQLSFGNQHLYFIGLRLGYLHLLSPEMVKQEFQDIGSEPLDPNFSLDLFQNMMKNKRGKLKTTLLNQEFIAGIGNRYSDEILWHAQLLPDKNIPDLDVAQVNRLYESMRYILQLGIQQGGYMDPLYKEDSKTGKYQMFVHDREGAACPRCHAPIVQKEISSRKTYFCNNCQH
ncbi:bifunctional DNA-formamidopyrimidine glycosylase/DNA-(apurinic or apyrimidinic site) lyase [Oceanobacillus sp. Castelsardo]|uniref:bifunctional DNA-formamidopyrimidine glycosylase/DNA-(apurinic or apyrimidinic site) lyase n=1 Tax=Oceanobacillus sp. Castelsardo TaxID=1851204 RepID=UPI000838F545|nr:bifunctional DNA-formamidopyrimidine glycosylase/DNA-(apurinic or apyrimidinic site) lyase [Oceanobacillus sp. Castelsardo]